MPMPMPMTLPLTPVLAIVPAAVVAIALAVARLRWSGSRARRSLLRKVVSMAEEIGSIGATIHADAPAGDPAFERLAADCNFLGRRAAHFLAQRSGLRRMPPERLQTALERLHDDHRRMVNLRSEVDLHLARRRFRSAPVNAGNLALSGAD